MLDACTTSLVVESQTLVLLPVCLYIILSIACVVSPTVQVVLLSQYVQASLHVSSHRPNMDSSVMTRALSPPQMAFKYLGIVLFPLFIGYGIYSLLYLEHKGWYSFVLGMMYGFLLTFGTYVAGDDEIESCFAECH